MAEFEELRLTVSLIDNASAGLARLNQEIKNLGSGANAANMDRVKRQLDETGGKLKQFGDQGAAVGVSMGGMVRGLTAAGAAITSSALSRNGIRKWRPGSSVRL